MRSGTPVRILLVGFMGAGKTSVGESLARALGWRFVDFDTALEAEVGLTVTEYFDEYGEARFREIEGRVARRLLLESEVVLASGGGWAAEADHLQSVPLGTLTVWLRVSPEEAVRRTLTEPGRRPLLGGPGAVEKARKLISERASFYSNAHVGVDTEGLSVEDVTLRVVSVLADEALKSKA